MLAKETNTTQFFCIGVGGSGGWLPSPNLFDPDKLDLDNWLQAAVAFGAKYAVLTAQHCSGYSMWPTNIIDESGFEYKFSTRYSSFRGGGYDAVRDFVNSCRKYGVEPGIYYNLNQNYYLNVGQGLVLNSTLVPGQAKVSQEQYGKIVVAQMRELWTNYGDLSELWFDGGCSVPGIADQVADMLKELQPHATTFKAVVQITRFAGSELKVEHRNIQSGALLTGVQTARVNQTVIPFARPKQTPRRRSLIAGFGGPVSPFETFPSFKMSTTTRWARTPIFFWTPPQTVLDSWRIVPWQSTKHLDRGWKSVSVNLWCRPRAVATCSLLVLSISRRLPFHSTTLSCERSKPWESWLSGLPSLPSCQTGRRSCWSGMVLPWVTGLPGLSAVRPPQRWCWQWRVLMPRPPSPSSACTTAPCSTVMAVHLQLWLLCVCLGRACWWLIYRVHWLLINPRICLHGHVLDYRVHWSLIHEYACMAK